MCCRIFHLLLWVLGMVSSCKALIHMHCLLLIKEKLRYHILHVLGRVTKCKKFYFLTKCLNLGLHLIYRCKIQFLIRAVPKIVCIPGGGKNFQIYPRPVNKSSCSTPLPYGYCLTADTHQSPYPLPKQFVHFFGRVYVCTS